MTQKRPTSANASSVGAEAREQVEQRVAEALARPQRRHLEVEHQQRDRHRHHAVGEGGDAAEAALAIACAANHRAGWSLRHRAELSPRAGWICCAIDQTIVALAVPELQQDLSLSATGTQWIVNA